MVVACGYRVGSGDSLRRFLLGKEVEVEGSVLQFTTSEQRSSIFYIKKRL